MVINTMLLFFFSIEKDL